VLTPEKFKYLWTKGRYHLVTYPADIVEILLIPESYKTFLVEAGLPDSAAPFLSFGPQYGEKPLSLVSEDWGLPEKFSCYRIIGSTGSGDPICIDESENGAVIYLNHDRNFQKVFINSSVIQLAESLLRYRYLVDETISLKGEDAYLSCSFSENLIKQVIKGIKEIDKPAMDKGCFWKAELQGLKV